MDQVANNLLLDAPKFGPDAATTPHVSEGTAGGFSGETGDLAALVEATSRSTMVCDVAGRIVQVTGTPELVFGFDRSGLAEHSVLGAVPAEIQPEFIKAFNTALGGLSSASVRYAKPAPWGGTLHVELCLVPLIENQLVVGVRVEASELSLMALLNAVFSGDFATAAGSATDAPVVVYFLDAGGQCTSMNDRWSVLAGQSPQDALGVGFLSRIPPEDQSRFRSVAALAHQTRSGWRIQLNVLTAAQTPWKVDSASASVARPDGSLLGYVGIIAPFSTDLGSPEEGAGRGQHSAGSSSSDPAPPSPDNQVQHTPVQNTQVQTTQVQNTPVQHTPVQNTQVRESVQSQEPTSAPFVSAPQHVLVPENILSLEAVSESDGQRWTPPIIKEGYTDPAFLASNRKENNEPHSDSAQAPGIDKVTGLSNRLLFAQGVGSTVARMQADALTVSVSFIDLHGLEAIRQKFGARSTNDYLFLLARRLEATIRSIESCGRIDGDVLAVLSVNWLFAEDLPVVAQRLLARLQEPLAAKDGGELVVAMDLGMAVARPGEHVNDLFGRAWEGLQRSKADPSTLYQIDYGA